MFDYDKFISQSDVFKRPLWLYVVLKKKERNLLHYNQRWSEAF